MTLDEFLTTHEQLAEKATKGPWHCSQHTCDVRTEDKELICTPTLDDQPFIAAARTALPIALKIVRELTTSPVRQNNPGMMAYGANAIVAERIINEEVTHG